MDLKLSDKKAFVTGRNAGIGQAIGVRLAQKGATLVLKGWEPETLANPPIGVEELTGRTAAGFSGDFSDIGVASQLFEEHPDVDTLITNLGVAKPEDFENISDETWRWFSEVNVLSGIRMARYYLPRRRRRAWGRGIFVSSESRAKS